MKQEWQVGKSLEIIKEVEEKEAKQKRAEAIREMQSKAPVALEKLKKHGGNVKKLFKGEIAAVVWVHFGKDVNPDKFKKAELEKILIDSIEAYPTVLGNL